ncbi:MAG: lamin tail domain-containing protein [Luteolibacter sp.]
MASIGVLLPTSAEPIDLSGGTAAQSTTLESFTADLAIDGVSNFTHTLGTDTDPTWQVLLPSARKFQEVTIDNRSSNRDRLQNIRVYVVDFNGDVNSDFNGGTLVHTSELLNPDNSLNGPSSITVDLGDALGNMIRIKRIVQPEDALNNNARTLSINEVTAEGPAQIVSFSTTRPTVTPGDPVKFEWEVSDSLTSLQINNGVGNVLPLTTDGVGSITFGSGPSVDTDYELTAVDANGSATASLNITVTNEPIIYSFTTASGFIETGSSVNLSWEVGGNATSLTLNGADVSGNNGISVSPTSDTEYILEAVNANGTASRKVFLRPVDPGVPVITEFLASNDEVLLDSDGDASDWIELHNPGSTSLSVAGFYLTDELDNLTKWLLPDVTIAPGEYLVVFASGKNRFNPAAELHTNFQLSSDGEYFALVKPDGVTAVTEFNPIYPEQSADVSFGYDGANNSEGYMQTPTPGAANESTVDGFVKDTDFTLDRGLYNSPIQVGISSATVGAEIRYTLDGTKPTATTGVVYASPISISETTVLRAAAYKEGFEPTNVDTHTYIFPSDVIADPIMDTDVTQDPTYGPQMNDALSSVPSISLNFLGDLDYTEREVSVEMINFEDGDIQVDAGVERFGGHATDFAKRSMRFTFRSEYGPGKLNFQLFGNHDYTSFQPSKAVNSFDLRAGNHDMQQRGAYLSNRYSDDALLDMGQIAPHGRYVNVYINGEYWGQYHLREGWDASMFSEYFGGSKDDYEAVDANDHFAADLDVYDGSGEFWEEATQLAAEPQPFTNVRSHVDIINEIDFILLYVNGNCESEFRAGGSATQEVPFKFYLKDADGYLRNPGNRSVLDDGPLDLMTALRNEGEPDYEILLADRIHKHFFNDGALSPARSIERLQDRVNEAQFSILAECARWGYRDPASFFSYHENLTDNFLPGQAATMIGKFEAAGMYPEQDAPVYSQHGGVIATGSGPTISISDSNLDVYYVFGSADTNPDAYVNSLDPRLPGGAVNTAASVLSFDGSEGSTTPIVQTGATWSYLDDGSDQGTAWFGTDFNASSWSTGPSQLGYGDDDEATVVGFIDTDPGTNGDQKNATTYFRKSGINIADLSVFESFTLNYTFDDGIAIYVNGQEVERQNLADDAAYDTYADDASADNQFGSIVLAPSLFVEGNNTIAAEIHQRTPTSSDISFDIQLFGNKEDDGGSPLVPVTYPGWLLSRSYNPSTGEWSALNEAFFTPEPIPADADNLVISEFSYHPDDPSGSAELAVAVDQDDFEFIEFMNVSNQPVDLEGVSISDGINFTFGANNVLPAGERMVICENRDAFVVRYGSQITTLLYGTDSVGLSNYGGKLSNSGERLLISDASGGVIQDFTYDDALPWPTESDGPGFSLVLISPSSLPDHNVASNWASSTQTGGSPGEESSVGFAGNTDADGDEDGLTAFMEYALGSSDSVRGDSTVVSDTESLMVDGETADYLTISFRRNLHSVNAVTILAQVGDDMSGWTGVPDVVLVSETDNLDGTSTVVYRSALPVGARLSGMEFIRLRLDQ